jgi:hypothetical protein
VPNTATLVAVTVVALTHDDLVPTPGGPLSQGLLLNYCNRTLHAATQQLVAQRCY